MIVSLSFVNALWHVTATPKESILNEELIRRQARKERAASIRSHRRRQPSVARARPLRPQAPQRSGAVVPRPKSDSFALEVRHASGRLDKPANARACDRPAVLDESRSHAGRGPSQDVHAQKCLRQSRSGPLRSRRVATAHRIRRPSTAFQRTAASGPSDPPGGAHGIPAPCSSFLALEQSRPGLAITSGLGWARTSDSTASRASDLRSALDSSRNRNDPAAFADDLEFEMRMNPNTRSHIAKSGQRPNRVRLPPSGASILSVHESALPCIKRPQNDCNRLVHRANRFAPLSSSLT